MHRDKFRAVFFTDDQHEPTHLCLEHAAEVLTQYPAAQSYYPDKGDCECERCTQELHERAQA